MALILIALASCRETHPKKETVYGCDSFEVYADSIVRGDKIYKAISRTEITNAWKADSLRPELPIYRSPQPLADALFCKATYETPYFTPLQIYLSLAAFRPEESMEALKSLVTKGRISHSNFPISAGNAAWSAAAWELYCVTGDRKWLRESYDIITSTLRKDTPITTSSQPPLIFGTPEYLTPHSDYYPSWMTPIDRFQTISTGVNALQAYTYDVLSEMASELGIKGADEYKKTANAIRNLINDLLWIPNLGFYGQYLYGTYYPILSQSTDQIANSLCVLFDIATPEMASSIVAHSPVLPEGATLVYPSINELKANNPLVQALRGLSASKVRNEDAIISALGSLWNIALDTPIPAESQAMVLKGLLGMEFTAKGISFNPMVPSHFPGKKTLGNFRYRDATLSVSVQGTGDKIAGFFIDSISMSPAFVPASISGHHHIDITLSGNILPPSQTTVVKPATLPELPVIKWIKPTTAQIMNFQTGYSYGVYINGTFLEEIQNSTYTYTPQSDAIIDIVPIAGQEYIGFSPASHVIAPGSSIINIPASSITPRRTPLHLIKHRETATKYIELAARHNTRITFYANAPEAGEYFINIGYSNGTTETAMRTLSVNGKDAGILVCPSKRPNDWVTVCPSNTLSVKLNAGPNQLALTYINTTILLNKITLLRKTDPTQR